MHYLYYSPFIVVLYFFANILFDIIIFGKLYRQTGYSPLKWKVVYQDLGSRYRRRNPFFSACWKNFVIRGNPDLILRKRYWPEYKVIDYKSRKSKCTNFYERIQLTLYQWLVLENTMFASVTGEVFYANKKIVPVPYSESALLSYVGACEKFPNY